MGSGTRVGAAGKEPTGERRMQLEGRREKEGREEEDELMIKAPSLLAHLAPHSSLSTGSKDATLLQTGSGTWRYLSASPSSSAQTLARCEPQSLPVCR